MQEVRWKKEPTMSFQWGLQAHQNALSANQHHAHHSEILCAGFMQTSRSYTKPWFWRCIIFLSCSTWWCCWFSIVFFHGQTIINQPFWIFCPDNSPKLQHQYLKTSYFITLCMSSYDFIINRTYPVARAGSGQARPRRSRVSDWDDRAIAKHDSLHKPNDKSTALAGVNRALWL